MNPVPGSPITNCSPRNTVRMVIHHYRLPGGLTTIDVPHPNFVSTTAAVHGGVGELVTFTTSLIHECARDPRRGCCGDRTMRCAERVFV